MNTTDGLGRASPRRHRHPWRSAAIGAMTAILALGGAAAAQANDDPVLVPPPYTQISVDEGHQLVGGQAKLTATTHFIDIESSPYLLQIEDDTTGLHVGIPCDANVCSKVVAYNTYSTHTYSAYITLDGVNESGSVNQVLVSWSSGIVLNANPRESEPGGSTQLTAKSEFTGTIMIKDQESGQTLKTCQPPHSSIQPFCSLKVTNSNPFVAVKHTYVAMQTVTSHGGSSVWISNEESVQWHALP